MNHGVYSFKHTLECTICTMPYNDYEILTSLTGCKHTFHKSCIDQWLLEKRECPICKMPLFDVNLIKKIVTMCTLNLFCNCLNSFQYNQANNEIMDSIDAFVIDESIVINTELYKGKTRIEIIDMIHQLKVDVAHILSVSNVDTLIEHPLVSRYNDIIYEHNPFNDIIDRYDTSTATNVTYSWLTDLLRRT